MIDGQPFLGAEALAAGYVNRHQLRTEYRRIFPGVYLHREQKLTLDHRIVGAWLWSLRRAVVAGLAAAALQGSDWIDDDVDIELIWVNARPPKGICTRQDAVLPGETEVIRGITVTTAERTAFDLGRRGSVWTAVARVDALLNARKLKPAHIESIAACHPRAPGLRQLETVLSLADPKSESLWETWLRLLLRRVGLPPVETQVKVYDYQGRYVARVDMAWLDIKVAVEYDGEQHRKMRRQYVRDVRRLEALSRLDWVVVRVLAGDKPADILNRVHAAIAHQLAKAGIDFDSWAAANA